MKSPRDYIAAIKVDEMNAKHIAVTGKINASLLIDIEKAMIEYAKQKVDEQREIMARHLNIRNVHKPEFKHGPDNQWF